MPALCQKQTLPQPQSNTSRCCRSTGTSNPSPFAILRLIDITNFVGNCTGNSAGLVPLSNEHRPLYVVGQRYDPALCDSPELIELSP